MRSCCHEPNLRIFLVEAPAETRSDCSTTEQFNWPPAEESKNEANRDVRNMRSGDDLSQDGSGIGQKSNPKFAAS
jgi:hypothetical protein